MSIVRRLLVDPQVGPWLWWGLLGGALLGAILTTLLIRYDLISPIVAVAALFTGAMYQMWQVLQEPYPLLPGTPHDLYFIGWPITLGVALAVGGCEWLIRSKLSSSGDSDSR